MQNNFNHHFSVMCVFSLTEFLFSIKYFSKIDKICLDFVLERQLKHIYIGTWLKMHLSGKK